LCNIIVATLIDNNFYKAINILLKKVTKTIFAGIQALINANSLAAELFNNIHLHKITL